MKDFLHPRRFLLNVTICYFQNMKFLFLFFVFFVLKHILLLSGVGIRLCESLHQKRHHLSLLQHQSPTEFCEIRINFLVELDAVSFFLCTWIDEHISNLYFQNCSSCAMLCIGYFTRSFR